MEGSAGSGPHPETTVSLADAAVAAAIAQAALAGRRPDRTPTLEQLLAAFGEGEPTPAARARAAAALRLAGINAAPDVHTAPPGSRIALSLPGGPGRRRGAVTVLLALAAIAIVLGVAYGASRLLGDDGRGPGLPGTDTTALTVSSEEDGTTTATAAGTATTTTATDRTATTTTTTRSPSRPRRAPAPAAEREMVVRLDASARPTFLCVDDGAGTTLFNGTLSGRRTFRGSRIRLNIGLASTRVTVNGRELTIPGSPAGFDISRRDGIQPLPSGRRPCA